ncbi:importin subunit alpha-4-like [Penaeus japonicus]|uniref:importin subunit alpha-4-like n=1 Tax=Penaeus japonicus TaxID=27405 RepID=UPI001C71632C|nr:importin subunit alpha-4-like [Penaeus japonicus]
MNFSSLTPPVRRRGKEIKSSNNAMDMESIRARRARLEEIIQTMRLPPLTQDSRSVHGSLSVLKGQETRAPSSAWLSSRRHSLSDPNTPLKSSGSRKPQPLTPEHGVQLYPFVSRPYANPLPGIGQTTHLSPTPIPDKTIPPASAKRRTPLPSQNEDEDEAKSQDKRPMTGRPAEGGGSEADDEEEGDTNDAEVLKKIVKGLGSNSSSRQLSNAIRARKLLSKDYNPPIGDFLEAGILTPLLPLMQENDHPKLQLEATWALTNIASGTSKQTAAVVDSGAVPILVKLLDSNEAEVREQAAWALGNIAGDGPKSRDAVMQGGVLRPLLNIIENTEKEGSTKVTTVRVAAWVFANIFRNKNLALTPEELQESVSALKILVNYPDSEVNVDALWALSYMSEQGDDEVEKVVQEDLLPVLVRHLGSDQTQMIVPALRATGNIVSGSDTQTEAALDAGVLPQYKQLLKNTRRNIRKETAWALSNVTAGNKDQIQKVVDEGLLPELVRVINEGFLDVQKEATWALSNLTAGGTRSQMEALVAAGGVEAFVTVLGVFETSVVTVALEGLENILGECEEKRAIVQEIARAGGKEKLEVLERNADQSVNGKAKGLLEKYFNSEEESSDESAGETQEDDRDD